MLAVQALIDALPETVTEDNATEIEEQLKAIDAEIEALTDEQAAKLDMTRYNAVCAALAALRFAAANIIPTVSAAVLRRSMAMNMTLG